MDEVLLGMGEAAGDAREAVVRRGFPYRAQLPTPERLVRYGPVPDCCSSWASAREPQKRYLDAR